MPNVEDAHDGVCLAGARRTLDEGPWNHFRSLPPPRQVRRSSLLTQSNALRVDSVGTQTEL